MFSKLGIQLTIIGASLALASLFGYLYINKVKSEAYNEGVAKTQAVLAKAIAKGALQDEQFLKTLNTTLDKIGKDVARSISKIKVENKTIHQEVIREVQNNPVYGECLSTDNGTRLLNEARGYVQP